MADCRPISDSEDSFKAVASIFPEVDKKWLTSLMTDMGQLYGTEGLSDRVCGYISSMTEYPKVSATTVIATSPNEKNGEAHSQKRKLVREGSALGSNEMTCKSNGFGDGTEGKHLVDRSNGSSTGEPEFIAKRAKLVDYSASLPDYDELADEEIVNEHVVSRSKGKGLANGTKYLFKNKSEKPSGSVVKTSNGRAIGGISKGRYINSSMERLSSIVIGTGDHSSDESDGDILPSVLNIGNDDDALPSLSLVSKNRSKKRNFSSSAASIYIDDSPKKSNGLSERSGGTNKMSPVSGNAEEYLSRSYEEYLPRVVLKGRRQREVNDARNGDDGSLNDDTDDELARSLLDDDTDRESPWINLSPVKHNSTKDDAESKFPCDSCSTLFLPDKLVVCFDGHLTCGKCMEDNAKKAIKGQGKEFSVDCPVKDCGYSIPLVELRKILPSFIVDAIEERMEHDALKEIENAQGMVACPGCNLVVHLDDDVKVLTCPQCRQSTCRYCKQEFTEDENSTHSQCGIEKSPDIPDNWVTRDPSKQGFVKILLEGDSQEYKEVAAKFYLTMSATITSIERVENPHLWRCYTLHKNLMLEKNGPTGLNEKHLFHGTSSHLIDIICEQNLDFRLSGNANGTVFGHGTYFATSASTSHSYSSKTRGGSGGVSVFTRPPVNPPGFWGPSNSNGPPGFWGPSNSSGPPGFWGPSNSNGTSPFNVYSGRTILFHNNHNSTQSSYNGPFVNITSNGLQVSYGNRPSSSTRSLFGSAQNSILPQASAFTSGSSSVSNVIANDPAARELFEKTGCKVAMYYYGWPVPDIGLHPTHCDHSNLPQGWPMFHENKESDVNLRYIPPPRPGEGTERYVMFVCRVLAGKYTKGNAQLKRPPPLTYGVGSALYDSVVDHESCPTIYVTFERWQNYPEYIITYTRSPFDFIPVQW